MLRQSIEQIEVDKLESDFPSHTHSIQKPRLKSQTPERLRVAMSSLKGAHSSNGKASQFETPRLS